MTEMNHAEISGDKVLEVLDYLAENGSTICMDGELYEDLFAALRQAATDERRIENRELVEVVHGHYIHFPEYETKRCSHCGIVFGDSLYEKYCPSCGALMDESRTGKSLNGKDDNHATN